MSKFGALLTACVLSAVVSGAAGGQEQTYMRPPSAPVLIQNYRIHAARTYTAVEANFVYRSFGAGAADAYPQSVEFNGRPMERAPLDWSKEPDEGCPRDKSVPRASAGPSAEQRADMSLYTLRLEGYRAENHVVVTDEAGLWQTATIKFEPKQFERPDAVVLSRSRNNRIRLKGVGDPKGETPGVGIRQGERFIGKDSLGDDSVRYDGGSNTLIVPARALRKFRRGSADFWVTSSGGDWMKTPGISTGGSLYRILYTDSICAKVVD